MPSNTSDLHKKKTLLAKNKFHTFNLHVERCLKVIIKGIRIKITDNDIKNAHTTLNFEVKHL